MSRIFVLWLVGWLVSNGGKALAADSLRLANEHVRLVWGASAKGWVLGEMEVRVGDRWVNVARPSGEYTLLYTAEKPASVGDGGGFPEPVYHYQTHIWEQAMGPVAMNTAGEAYYFYPRSGSAVGSAIHFIGETPVGVVETEWSLSPGGDVLVTERLMPRKDGYFSMASPSLVRVQGDGLAWGVVPGYCQGKAVNPDLETAYGYGQGIPDRPVVYRDRCAGTLCPVITMRGGVSLGVIPEPGVARDSWRADSSTQQDWQLGLSLMNRRGVLTPTVYHPVLGERGSLMRAGEELAWKYRYSMSGDGWDAVLHHAIDGVYHFGDSLALRHNRQSLTRRVRRMMDYLAGTRTSMWHVEDDHGTLIGAQSYLGGVVGSQGDAMKNSDYGAMWMTAAVSGRSWFRDSVLPYALNFKLRQQQTDSGFFRGAAMGQYYLAKKKTFVEEWGDFVEPISLTYYTLVDIGNILLFDAGNRELRDRLRLGADLLLRWQKADGSWAVAYDRRTHRPLFTELEDLRPTFYGLVVAWRLLKDDKYLAGAERGARWLIRHGVDSGRFLGVCGDSRYVPDFATAQTAQALLDLYDLTHRREYLDAAVRTGRMYTTSIYTHPVASRALKTVRGRVREDWEISQSGLGFEHGGTLGSANNNGPIALCSHAGLFIRLAGLTHDTLFAEMARAAAIGRDAFVDSATSVASYYWNTMNRGAGPYPHHAWWQIGWITDYLLAEAELRSGGRIHFPRGFMTPKVGPHESVGFAPGVVNGVAARLVDSSG
ncbi:MAG: glycerophosphoryl diester phosphodiesterase, partial [Bacteroidetes bacterium]|nr:glycerophosphoryl diester phosphodiesterase [Bacteroidota bacterium]